MEKVSVARSIHARKISHPNWIYDTLGLVWKLFVYPKYKVHYTFKKDFRKVEGPFFFISNHASRLDYIFVGAPLLPLKMNFVAGYNEFHRSHLSLVFRLLRVIPKKNFTPDLYTVKEISRVIKSGHGVCIFPEGMSSISGANQPVALGTGKLFKHHKVPVYYSVIRGGYLTSPKYNLRDRVGHVEVEYDQLFTVEDLERMTPAEIEDKSTAPSTMTTTPGIRSTSTTTTSATMARKIWKICCSGVPNAANSTPWQPRAIRSSARNAATVPRCWIPMSWCPSTIPV